MSLYNFKKIMVVPPAKVSVKQSKQNLFWSQRSPNELTSNLFTCACEIDKHGN